MPLNKLLINSNTTKMQFQINLLFILLFTYITYAQVTQLNKGSYRTEFPSSTNNYPVMSTVFWADGAEQRFPELSENYSGKPIPSNDWWTSIHFRGHNTTQTAPLYALPLSLRTTNKGVSIDYPNALSGNRVARSIHYADFNIGLEGMTTSGNPKLKDYTDWTVTFETGNDAEQLEITLGHGLPFVYFKKNTDTPIVLDTAGIDVIDVISNEGEIFVFESKGNHYAIFSPKGTEWERDGVYQYHSDLNGKDYFTLALLPDTDQDTYPIDTIAYYQKRAFAYPVNTTMTYDYSTEDATVTTHFNIETALIEDTDPIPDLVNETIICLLPHQWAYSDAVNTTYTYHSTKGEMRVITGNNFNTKYKYHGVVSSMPNLFDQSESYDSEKIKEFLADASQAALPLTESYNQGKYFNKFIPIVHIADQLGEETIKQEAIRKIKHVLEEWLTTDSNETRYLFYYNKDWNYLAGYPDGHYQASLMNDRQFHWGYFVQAAACIAQYDKEWILQYEDMINLLIKDAANWEREDMRFPYLRSMDPYVGHSWAGGSGNSINGNNMESSSESMNFNTGVILWGMATDNRAIRDLGVYLYTTEATAIEEYWHDVHKRNFPVDFGHTSASRVYGNGIDMYTFWTGSYAACYGINMLPIQGGSTYLGYHPEYTQENYEDYFEKFSATKDTDTHPEWFDIFWSYQALYDPEAALENFNTNPNYNVEFGETRLHTYHWLHNLNTLGKINTNITANYPLANVYESEEYISYVAQNYQDEEITINFSNGESMDIPANALWTKRVSKQVDESIPQQSCSEILEIAEISAEADQSGNPIENAIDKDSSTRWAGYGDPVEVLIDLGQEYELCSMYLDLYRGLERNSYFSVYYSIDDMEYHQILDNVTNSKEQQVDQYDLEGNMARFIKLSMQGNASNNWNAIQEIYFSGKQTVLSLSSVDNRFKEKKSSISIQSTASVIKVNSLEDLMTNITLYTLNGKIIYDKKILSKNTQVPIARLSSGLYLLKVNRSNTTITKKVIIP